MFFFLQAHLISVIVTSPLLVLYRWFLKHALIIEASTRPTSTWGRSPQQKHTKHELNLHILTFFWSNWDVTWLPEKNNGQIGRPKKHSRR